MNNTNKILKINQAAEYLGISKWTIYKLVKEGRIRPIIEMKSFCFTFKDLDSIKWRRL